MRPEALVNDKIRLSDMKWFALQMLPEGPLRDDILSQPDEVSADEYIANCRVWLRLLRLRR